MVKLQTSNFATPQNEKSHFEVAKLLAAFLSVSPSMELVTSLDPIVTQISSLLVTSGSTSIRMGTPAQPVKASAGSQFAKVATRYVVMQTPDTYILLRCGLRLLPLFDPLLLSVLITAAAAAAAFRKSSPRYQRTKHSTQEACSGHQKHPSQTGLRPQ